jgi:hypothetical protein
MHDQLKKSLLLIFSHLWDINYDQFASLFLRYGETYIVCFVKCGKAQCKIFAFPVFFIKLFTNVKSRDSKKAAVPEVLYCAHIPQRNTVWL